MYLFFKASVKFIVKVSVGVAMNAQSVVLSRIIDLSFEAGFLQ